MERIHQIAQRQIERFRVGRDKCDAPAGLQIADAFDGCFNAAGRQFGEHAGALTAGQFLHFVGDRFAAPESTAV